MIIEAKISDLEKIVKMKIKMYKEAQLYNKLAENAFEKILEKYKELYNDNKMRHFCFEVNGEIIACAGGFIKNDIPFCFFKTNFYGFIGDVYTEINYRNNGYATQLTKKVIEWLKESGAKTIKLAATEEGKNIYKKLGFEYSDAMILEFK